MTSLRDLQREVGNGMITANELRAIYDFQREVNRLVLAMIPLIQDLAVTDCGDYKLRVVPWEPS